MDVGRRPCKRNKDKYMKETRSERMENESIGKRGMDINYKGSQSQTERAVVQYEEEEDTTYNCIWFKYRFFFR